jgi:phospholipid/cholesterol/gamma-HCH transport system ATP-binding protein
MKTKIELKGVTKSFGDNHVLKGIDLKVEDGESLVLIGGSAAGKTLILKCILGLVSPDSGAILIDGEDTTRLSRRARAALYDRMGMLFQQNALFDSLSVWENVAFRLLQDGRMSDGDARETAIARLASVGLDADVGDLSPAEISGGMQKRVGFARAIAAAPEIVLLDEPTAGLDPIMTNIVIDQILDGVRDLGATTLSITSDMVGAKRVADRIAMIHEGRIIWCGHTAEVEDCANPYVDQFVHNRGDGPIEMALTAD